VGPRPDGSLPEPQVKALQGLGSWLSANGEAIYDTSPWVRPVDALKYKGDVHYTRKGSTLYVHVNTTVIGAINLPNPGIADGSSVVLLDTGEQLTWVVEGDRLEIRAPQDGWQSRIVPVLRIQLRG
jgi:alpha-L-fucosidase